MLHRKGEILEVHAVEEPLFIDLEKYLDSLFEDSVSLRFELLVKVHLVIVGKICEVLTGLFIADLLVCEHALPCLI